MPLNLKHNSLNTSATLVSALLLFCNTAFALEVRDGRFYENGTRIKLWGAHLTPGLSVAQYATTDAMVSRIQAMGFNAIAIWGISEMFHDGVPKSKRGDRSPMDRLDYLIYRCREAGLYVWFAAATRIPKPRISDYTSNQVTPEAAYGRYKATRKIQAPHSESHLAKRALYLDKGLQQAKLRFITQLLNHTNPYTKNTYKNQDGLLLYLSDENGFISSAAGIARYPKNQDPYVTRLLQNETSKYDSSTIASYKIAEKWHKTLMGRIKSLAPNIPVNLDTTGRVKLFDLYACKDADFCAYGLGGSQGSGSQSMLWKPPLFANKNQGSREFKLRGKPWIMYTGNAQVSADYRAEWPLRIAAFASFQDADGVFFWLWGRGIKNNAKYSSLPVYDPKLKWDISADEVLMAASRIAGLIFINSYIPPAPNPVTFTFGKKTLENWQYGYNWQAMPIFQKVRQAAYTTGAILELDLGKDIEFSQDRPLKDSIENPLIWANPKGDRRVIWDWGKGQLVVDTPEAKAITGFFGKAHSFTGGIALSNISEDFISFGLVSEDNAPIERSRLLTTSLISQSQNTGFLRGEDDTILNAGSAPAIVSRVSAELTLPNKMYEVSKMDFSGRVFDKTLVNDGKVTFSQEDPDFILDIHAPQ
ncbi:hypothetical protein ACFL3A_05210 [Pseudomonadota bacterium]